MGLSLDEIERDYFMVRERDIRRFTNHDKLPGIPTLLKIPLNITKILNQSTGPGPFYPMTWHNISVTDFFKPTRPEEPPLTWLSAWESLLAPASLLPPDLGCGRIKRAHRDVCYDS